MKPHVFIFLGLKSGIHRPSPPRGEKRKKIRMKIRLKRSNDNNSYITGTKHLGSFWMSTHGCHKSGGNELSLLLLQQFYCCLIMIIITIIQLLSLFYHHYYHHYCHSFQFKYLTIISVLQVTKTE